MPTELIILAINTVARGTLANLRNCSVDTLRLGPFRVVNFTTRLRRNLEFEADIAATADC